MICLVQSHNDEDAGSPNFKLAHEGTSTTELWALEAIRDMTNSEAGAGGNSKERETYMHDRKRL